MRLVESHMQLGALVQEPSLLYANWHRTLHVSPSISHMASFPQRSRTWKTDWPGKLEVAYVAQPRRHCDEEKSHMQSGSAEHAPAELYLRPHDIWQLKPADDDEALMNMQVESVRQAVAVRVLQAALQVDPSKVHSLFAWHCVCD
jgi:hypothetical protein